MNIKIKSFLYISFVVFIGTANYFHFSNSEFTLAGEQSFPGRSVYSHVPYISADELFNKREDVIIVDVRSKLEHQTLRIKGALHIPVASAGFASKLRELRETTAKSIAFYCNGQTCFKSYEATDKAMAENISNVYAFDAGVFVWARAHPEQAVLLGQSPVNPRDLISKKELRKRLLEPGQFKKRMGSSIIVVDVRNHTQHGENGPLSANEKLAILNGNGALDASINEAKKKRVPLLVYDATGKQVRWIQYYIEKKGLKNYYFLKGGANSYSATQIARIDSKTI